MRKINIIIIMALVFQLVFGAVAQAEDAFIRKLVITNSDENVVCYFNLEGAFTKSIVEAIDNGISTTFTFLIKLRSVKTIWFDSSIADIKVYRTIKYDSLKKQYVVTQRVSNGEDEELKRTGSFVEAKKAVNDFKNVFVVESQKLKTGDRYELRVKAELEKVILPFYLEYILIFVSVWDFETDWYVEEFTY